MKSAPGVDEAGAPEAGTRPGPAPERGSAALARANAALESDLLATSLELRRAREEYEALAMACETDGERLRSSEAEREALRRGVATLEAELAATRHDRDTVKAMLEEIRATRVWRLGLLYWRFLRRLGLLPAKAPDAPVAAPQGPPGPGGNAPASTGPAAVPAAGSTLLAARPGRTFGLRRDPRVPGRPDIVCFSIVEWEFLFQRPQQLLSRLAERGHRVFYVSQFFEPAAGAPVLHRLRSRVYALRLRGSSMRLFSEELTPADADALFASLSSLGEREGIESAVSLVDQPFWWPLAERARRELGWRVLYDCMDDHGGFLTNARPVAAAERGILEGADAIVATSRLLAQRLRSAGRPVELVPNGCDVEYFSSMRPRPLGRRPTVGYYGCIADWFDADLVADVAGRRPDWDFVLIGPTYLADLARLSTLPNVSFPGMAPYGELLGRIEAFDVFLLPFRRSSLTDAANPVKAYEVMATGRPLVAVPLPELEPFGDLVRFASDAAELERRIEEALREDDPTLAARRLEFARRNSWDERADAFERIVTSLGTRPETGPGRGKGGA